MIKTMREHPLSELRKDIISAAALIGFLILGSALVQWVSS
jgi:hypothetical protein